MNENTRIVTLRGVDQGFPKRSVDSMLYQGRWFNLESNEVVVGLGAAYDLGVSTFDGVSPIKLYAPRAGKGQVFSERDILKSTNVMASGIFTLNEELNNSLVFADIGLVKNLFDVDPKNVGSIDIYQNNISAEKVASFFGSSVFD